VIKHGITAGDLGDLVYGFPTFTADIKSMLYARLSTVG
jgi:hypothetical protein